MVRNNLRLTAFYWAVISWAVFCFATITKRSCCVGRSGDLCNDHETIVLRGAQPCPFLAARTGCLWEFS